MLPVGHCQVPPPLRPLQAETKVVGSQQGLRCGSICPVTTGKESVVNRCATSPHSVQISHPRLQGPSTQETILSDHPQQCTVLPRCCLLGSPWRLAWHQRSSGSMPFEYAVDGSMSQTHTGSNSTLLNALTVKCKHHLYCGFGARRSHLTLHWMSAQGSIGFRWGTITGPYHANFSQVETQKFDPHWFYCLQWGCNNLFCQECMIQCQCYSALYAVIEIIYLSPKYIMQIKIYHWFLEGSKYRKEVNVSLRYFDFDPGVKISQGQNNLKSACH